MTRPFAQVEQARELHRSGLNSCQIARHMNIPRATIRGWIDPRYVRLVVGCRGCFRCERTANVPGPDYVYLLGLYLGDGCLSIHGKGVWRLRIFQDTRYAGLIAECRLAMASVTTARVGLRKCIGCVEISAYWKHWIHLFPQHGPGLKWRRRIVLEQWQRELTSAYPAQLLRGLIHSDGCRSLNTVRRRWSGREAQYAYPRYFFTNASDDIRNLFTDTCDQLEVRWTQTNARSIAISRHGDVAFLDRFIGPKS